MYKCDSLLKSKISINGHDQWQLKSKIYYRFCHPRCLRLNGQLKWGWTAILTTLTKSETYICIYSINLVSKYESIMNDLWPLKNNCSVLPKSFEHKKVDDWVVCCCWLCKEAHDHAISLGNVLQFCKIDMILLTFLLLNFNIIPD